MTIFILYEMIIRVNVGQSYKIIIVVHVGQSYECLATSLYLAYSD